MDALASAAVPHPLESIILLTGLVGAAAVAATNTHMDVISASGAVPGGPVRADGAVVR
jgi:hypothetical protein